MESSPVASNRTSLWGHLSRVVLNAGVYMGLLLVGILVLVAYQVRPAYDIVIGSPVDGPYLTGFNSREEMQGSKPLPFRWTTGNSHIVLAGVGGQDFEVTLTLSGNRPAGQPPSDLTVEAGGKQLFHGNPSPDLIDYTLPVSRDLLDNGTLDLHLISNTFTPAGDTSNRPLGVTVTRVRVTPANNNAGFIAPPGDIFGALLGATAILGLSLALLGWGAGAIAGGAGVLALLAAALLVFDRLWLTSGAWYEAWSQVLLLSVALVLLVDLAASFMFRISSVPWQGWARRLLLTLVLVAFAVRLAGELHPQIFIVDLGFHIHRFEVVHSGQLLFMIPSAEWAGRSTFYLPTAYVYMLPFEWLVGDTALLIRIAMGVFGTLGAVLLYYIACAALRDPRAGLFAGALYVVFPISVLLFSWGILTNVFGEFFALAVLALLAGARGRPTPRRLLFWVLVFSLTMALLSHPGVVQLVSVAVGLLIAGLFFLRKRVGGLRIAGWTFAALALSWSIAYLIYYRNFLPGMIQTFADINRQRASQPSGALHLRVGGGLADRSLGLISTQVTTLHDWLLGGLKGFWNEARAYYRAWPLAGAALAYVGMWPGRAPGGGATLRGRTTIVLAAVGWTLAVMLFAVVGWVLNLYVRYALFALPVLALGCGVLLASIWRRGGYCKWLVAMVVLFFAVEAIGLWQYRINYGLK